MTAHPMTTTAVRGAAVRMPRAGVLRIGPRLSVRVHRRGLAVTLALGLVVVALGAVALTLGEYPIAVDRIVAALIGDGSEAVRRIVVDWRLPRVLLAVIGGAALGLSGAIFQSITRNPLGSPDIIGFNTGAYTGALVVIVLLGGSAASVTLGALIGGLVTGFAVYLLAFRRGVHGYRLIVVGIAVSAVLASVNSWMIVASSLEVAIGAASWGAGNLDLVGWTDVAAAALVVVIAIPVVAVLSRRLRVLELGDDAARALGVRTEQVRIAMLVIGVALVAVVTASVGPIVFVALAAPQLAHRLARTPGVALAPSAAMGAFLLLASDMIAQRLFAPLALPVGIVTACLGGAYLIGLLVAQARRSV